ncbi:MAG: hypothetical protein M3209_13625 [Acidobacteriota bacterium]|nr:hypothetical protein [Acidobacteriota bacterium]
MKKIFALPLVFLFPALIFAHTTKTQGIKQINSYVKKLSNFVEKNPKNLEIYANISETKKPKWKKFESEKSLQKYGWNKSAYVWRQSSKIVVTNSTFTSESGDWVKYVYHFFREDGTLAKVESQFNTFHGNFSLVKDIYFDRKGNILKKTAKYLDLTTHKPKKPTKDDILNNGDNIKDFYYKRTNKLPFIFLIARK